jgi:Holliday junction resolvasome RuvABC endonuclease subunit
MNYIGIDFSLNSPAFCVFKDKQFFWGSLTRSDRSSESLKKSKDKPYAVLDGDSNIDLIFLDKKQMPEEYSERERIKIDYFQELVDTFWSHIESFIEDKNQVCIAMEGLSFASNGNALIDISMATALIRKKIVDSFGSQNFFVYSPTSIKKFAKKGNAKKDELYHAIIEKKVPDTNFSHLTQILDDNKTNWITGSGSVNKPMDDIIDATWICLYLIENETH